MRVQAAYLALTQFLDHNHELVLLLVNTLLSDLKSDNFINGEQAFPPPSPSGLERLATNWGRGEKEGGGLVLELHQVGKACIHACLFAVMAAYWSVYVGIHWRMHGDKHLFALMVAHCCDEHWCFKHKLLSYGSIGMVAYPSLLLSWHTYMLSGIKLMRALPDRLWTLHQGRLPKPSLSMRTVYPAFVLAVNTSCSSHVWAKLVRARSVYRLGGGHKAHRAGSCPRCLPHGGGPASPPQSKYVMLLLFAVAGCGMFKLCTSCKLNVCCRQPLCSFCVSAVQNGAAGWLCSVTDAVTILSTVVV
eukprot:1157890-Pelagomonas_calceolata.AAC.5